MKNTLQNDLTPAPLLEKGEGFLKAFHREHISGRRVAAGPAVADRRAVGDTPRRSRPEKVRGQARPAPDTFNLAFVLYQIARAT